MRAAIVAALLLTCSGCALVNPHVHSSSLFDHKYAADSTTSNMPLQTTPKPVADLLDAIDAANDQQAQYLSAAAQYSTLRNSSPLVAGALGVTSLVLASTGGSSGWVTGTGLGAAGALGLSAYYNNQPREQLYYGAALAVGCFVLAQRPLKISEAAYDTLTSELETLAASIGRVRAAAAGGVLANGKYSAADVQRLVEAASATYARGDALRAAINTAGFTLREQVKGLVAKVDQEIVKTEPDPQAIRGLIGGLPGIAAGFLADTTPTPALANRGAQEHGLAINQLDDDVDGMVRAASAVALRLGAADADAARAAADAAGACKPPHAEGSLAVQPDTASLTLRPGGQQRFTVSGGAGIPTFGLAGDYPGDTVKVSGGFGDSASVGGQAQIVVTATDKATGTAILTIADRLTTHATTLSIAAPSDGAGGASMGAPNRQAQPAPATAWTADLNKLALARTALKLGPGGLDDPLRTALANEAATRDIGRSDPISSRALFCALIQEQRATAVQDVTPSGDEKLVIDTPGATDLCEARKSLNLTCPAPPASPIDAAFRRAIWDLQLGTPDLPITGKWDAATRKVINDVRRRPAALARGIAYCPKGG